MIGDVGDKFSRIGSQAYINYMEYSLLNHAPYHTPDTKTLACDARAERGAPDVVR